MNELPSFFRTNTETLALQHFRHMEKAGLASDRNKKRFLTMASDLADALADSIEAMDPAIFSGRLGPYLKKGMGRFASSHILHIVAFLEKTAMEQNLNGEQTRLLWALFHNARTAMINIAGGNIKKQQDIAGKPYQKTISTLKMEIEERKQAEERLRERGPGWASPLFTASSNSTMALSPSQASKAREAPSRYIFPSFGLNRRTKGSMKRSSGGARPFSSRKTTTNYARCLSTYLRIRATR